MIGVVGDVERQMKSTWRISSWLCSGALAASMLPGCATKAPCDKICDATCMEGCAHADQMCHGFYSTCWRGWPENCPTCPSFALAKIPANAGKPELLPVPKNEPTLPEVNPLETKPPLFPLPDPSSSAPKPSTLITPGGARIEISPPIESKADYRLSGSDLPISLIRFVEPVEESEHAEVVEE